MICEPEGGGVNTCLRAADAQAHVFGDAFGWFCEDDWIMNDYDGTILAGSVP